LGILTSEKAVPKPELGNQAIENTHLVLALRIGETAGDFLGNLRGDCSVGRHVSLAL
jgi:hypothetical protein